MKGQNIKAPEQEEALMAFLTLLDSRKESENGFEYEESKLDNLAIHNIQKIKTAFGQNSDFLTKTHEALKNKSILELVAEKGDVKIMKHLLSDLKMGFLTDIDKKYSEGNTLLHIAVKNGNYEMAKFLIDNGARIEILNNAGEIPITLCSSENTEIKELLEKTKKLDSDLHQAIKSKDEDKIGRLLDEGARPNGGITQARAKTTNQAGVIVGKFVSNISLAIESDSSIQIMDLLMNKYVKTTPNPLEIACTNDKIDIFKHLLEAKIVDNRDELEKEIPNLLKKSFILGSIEMVKDLLKKSDEIIEEEKSSKEDLIRVMHYTYNDPQEETPSGMNVLQMAIKIQYFLQTEEEKQRGKDLISFLIDEIIKNYDDYREIINKKNDNNIDARFMLQHLNQGNLGNELLAEIDDKMNQKEIEKTKMQREMAAKLQKQKENERIKRLKAFEDRAQKRQQELKEAGLTDSNPKCMTALCCCLVNLGKRVVAKDNESIGIWAEAQLGFESPALAPNIETKVPQQSIAKSIEVEAPNNTNSMLRSMEISEESSVLTRIDPVEMAATLTLTATPAVTPSKPSQGMGMPRAMETSSTTLA